MKKPSGPKMRKKGPAAPVPPEPLRPRTQNAFPIVGIGASAGGLEALELFLKHVPAGSGMAFVIVQHLDPTHKGIMVELLQRTTPMPVVQVRDRLKVEPDRVYVIPPNKDMSILHGVLHLLEPAAPRGLRLPIDFFFRSLADDRRSPEHRRHPVGHGLRRHAGPAGHQGESRGGLCAGAGLGQVRRHAAQRHRRRSGRRGRPGGGTAGQDHRLSPSTPLSSPSPIRPGRARPRAPWRRSLSCSGPRPATTSPCTRRAPSTAASSGAWACTRSTRSPPMSGFCARTPRKSSCSSRSC